MSHTSKHWDELSLICDHNPSKHAFRALVSLLDTWPDPDASAAIEVAANRIANWPDAVRQAPWSWCKAAANGSVLPTWSLVRSMQLDSDSLTKGPINLAQLAHHANLENITQLQLPGFSSFNAVSFLYHCPERFPRLQKFCATDEYADGDVRALAESPLWKTLTEFHIESLSDSLHFSDASRIVPQLDAHCPIEHLTLRAYDLVRVFESGTPNRLRSASVFIRSISEARAIAERPELATLQKLSLAFRCGFDGRCPMFEPFLGNVIEPDEAAAQVFFEIAELAQLQELSIIGHSQGYWGREGLGTLGLENLISSGLLRRLTRLHLELLPLGDAGIMKLAPELGSQLHSLELIDLFCRNDGAIALSSSPGLENLRCLDLSANCIEANGIKAFASTSMPHLRELKLGGPSVNPYYWNVGQQPILDDGAIAVCNSPIVRNVEHLDLNNCFLSDETLNSVFKSTELQKIKWLDLSNNEFSLDSLSTSSFVASSIWRRVETLKLNHCSLGNKAISALTRVAHAPNLRVLELAYNNIGPEGAYALSQWTVMKNVWCLQLHDNLIGDEGLEAIAQSPNFERVLELDLEQDCWNSRTFQYSDAAARVLAQSSSLPRLDAIFTGVVDEYHATGYSTGFSRAALEEIRTSDGLRPAARATCSDFSELGDDYGADPFDENKELDDKDFRAHSRTLRNIGETGEAIRGQQLSSPERIDIPYDDLPPPAIGRYPEVEFDKQDVIEGLEYLDQIEPPDHVFSLEISFEDEERPIPEQSGKFIGDTLSSIFRASGTGTFELSGGSSREDDDGSIIESSVDFQVGIHGKAEPAVAFIRETLWWICAPENTSLNDYPLVLAEAPSRKQSRHLQLANLKASHYDCLGNATYRLDREPFTDSQRATVTQLLSDAGGTETYERWDQVKTSDGGRGKFHVRHLDDPNFHTLNVTTESLSQELVQLVFQIADQCDLMLLPMAVATNESVASSIDCEWPSVRLISCPSALYENLLEGPYAWWCGAN